MITVVREVVAVPDLFRDEESCALYYASVDGREPNGSDDPWMAAAMAVGEALGNG